MMDLLSDAKICFKCERELPRAAFYVHPKMADGLLGKCKECTKRDVTTRRQEKIEDIRAYDLRRASLPHRRAANIQWHRKDRIADPRKRRAHTRVRRAIEKGRLIPLPCCKCGVEKVVAHHEDYDKPLEVVWYCYAHHAQRHIEIDSARKVVTGDTA